MAVGAPKSISGLPRRTFRLPATDGRTYALKDVAGEKGTVIVFICNHCPYVRAVIDRLVADARLLMGEGVGFAAICSNDAESYPEDFVRQHARIRPAARFPLPLSSRRKPGRRARLWRALHARLLRLRPRPQAQISRPPRRRPHLAAPARRAPRARRGHARRRRDWRSAGEPGPLHWLLDQVEGGAL